jgi:hypothetical protein
MGINPNANINPDVNEVFPTSKPLAIDLVVQKFTIDSETIKYPRSVVINDHVPNSCIDKDLVTIKENTKPVTMLLVPTKKASKPE